MALPLVAVALGLLAVSVSHAASKVVRTQSGELEGVERGGIAIFAGVPYAKPPVGDLRWRAPQEPERWNGTRKAEVFGPDCMQRASATTAAPRPMSEDCLYLNIWAPASRYATKLPVMVWIHGGAFRVGSGSQPLYDGTSFAYRGVVLVTINYRLDKLGFFAHPAMAGEDPGAQGNYGLQDQIAALKWVRQNITAFGGDARNITLFGESAGGTSVNYLMISPEAKGLFQRAIVESGAFRFPSTSLQQAQSAGEAAAKSWGVTGTDATALRSVPPEKIISSGANGDTRVGPVIDGRIVPEDIRVAFEAGRVARVPYLIGSNSYEAGFFPDWADGLAEMLAGQWTKIEAVYDGYGTRQKPAIEAQLATDIMATAATREIARSAARNGLKTYVYHYSFLRPSQRGKVHGPIHVDEVYAVFDAMNLVEPQASAPEVRRVVADVQERWVQFARTGRPTLDEDQWPQFKPEDERVLEFSNNGPVVRTDFARDRLDLADALATTAAPRIAAK